MEYPPPFTAFIRRNSLDPDNPQYWTLDEELVEERFYILINYKKSFENRAFGVYASILSRMVRVVKVYVSNMNNLLHSIIPPKLFFTYTDEEDHNTAAFNTMGFAVASNK